MNPEILSAAKFRDVLPGMLCQYAGMHVLDVTALIGERLGKRPSISTMYDVVNGTSRGRQGLSHLSIDDGVLIPANGMWERCLDCSATDCEALNRIGARYNVSQEGNLQSSNQLICIPGIIIDARTTFGEVVSKLGELGMDFGTTFVDYPPAVYTQEGFDAQVEILLGQPGNVKPHIVAASFGAGSVIDALGRNPKLQSRIAGLTLVSPMYKIDGFSPQLAELARRVREGKLTRQIYKKIVGRFGFDEGYIPEGRGRNAFLEAQLQGLAGYASRINHFCEGRNITSIANACIETPTSIMWFPEDYQLISPYQMKVIERILPNGKVLDRGTLQGKHSTVATNARAIARIIRASLQ